MSDWDCVSFTLIPTFSLARGCANGSTQQEYTCREQAASPTKVSMEALLVISVRHAHKKRQVLTLDIPNTFVQTPIPSNQERIIMRITGKLVDFLVELFPEKYRKYVRCRKNKLIIHIIKRKALYSMMLPSVIFYKHFRKDIKKKVKGKCIQHICNKQKI